MPQPPETEGWWSKNFHFLFVAACCVVIAALLGVHQPEFKYQKTVAQQSWGDGCFVWSGNGMAVASGQKALMPVRLAGNSTTLARFSGSGFVESLVIGRTLSEQTGVRRLLVNGKAACSPCEEGRSYPVERGGDLEILLEASNHTSAPPEKPALLGISLKTAYLENLSKNYLEDEVLLSLRGSWQASENSAMPSSFYQTDAPYHIQRVAVLKDYLPRLQIPWNGYSFLSLVPAGAFAAATGASSAYAFKVYQIALFFVPIALFAFFSRRLGRGANAAFLFSSVLYLFLPVHGLMTGGSPDLFLYGMAPYTLATYLSLFFLVFAYDFLAGGKTVNLALAALFFTAAFACNQRVLMPMGIMAACLAIAFLMRREYFKVAALASACCFASGFFTVPFAEAFFAPGGSSVETLGGVTIASPEQGMVAFLQAGYLVLPVLSLAGACAAYAWRQRFALLLGIGAAAVFLFATSPQVNQAFPFVDGLRLLPSFFLVAFFLSGLGAAWLYGKLLGAVLGIQERLGTDHLTAAGAVVFALVLPCAMIFYVAASSTVSQLRDSGDSLLAASDYATMEQVAVVVGKERAVFEPNSLVSQYPVFGFSPSAWQLRWFESADARVDAMRGLHLRYVVLGPAKETLPGVPQRLAEYKEATADGRFREILLAGNSRLLELRDGEPGLAAYLEGGNITGQRIEYDRAYLEGVCQKGECVLTLFSTLPKTIRCENSGSACGVSFGADGRLSTTLPGGKIALRLEPELPLRDWAVALICIFGLCATLLLWARLPRPLEKF